MLAYFFVRESSSRSSQFKRTWKALILYATHSHQMPVGNLRTAANNDQDDDPRALRPIPIATKDMVSFVEKNNAAGQNAEVVRFMFFNVFPQRLDLIVSRMMRRAHFFWFCSSLRLSEKGIREREMRVKSSSRLSYLFLSLSLSRASFLVNRSDLNRWSRCFVL